ncbi:MAG: DEAD/DEAH box helicase, partial [Desulfobacteraceae bacterium]
MSTTSLRETSTLPAIHPGLQKIITEKGWKDLSPIQRAAIPIILNGDDCIVEAPTAGGKTEAVLFPVLTHIAHRKKSSVQILYLAPLRALLNDIELRAEAYAKACGLHSFKWHGDVSQKEKLDELRNPSQLLLTTPESLEAILLRKAGWHCFFADLDVIIIDESHNFASGDRGAHLISLLSRLEKSIHRNPQRIAVTATIGNPEQMLEWLAGTDRKTGKRIHVNSIIEKEKDFEILFFDERNNLDEQPETFASYRQFKSLYQLLPLKKSIVFGGSRTNTESLASAINQMNNVKGSKNSVKVRTHHSAVSKYYREEAENLIKLRDSIESGLEAIISTSTLELGIDVGELDQVVQIGALSSSSAFLQRVGRTGRRLNKSQFFRGLCTSEEDLILLSAVVSLGQKGISETIHFPTKAFHLLAH